jgi:hypothetical protein
MPIIPATEGNLKWGRAQSRPAWAKEVLYMSKLIVRANRAGVLVPQGVKHCQANKRPQVQIPVLHKNKRKKPSPICTTLYQHLKKVGKMDHFKRKINF